MGICDETYGADFLELQKAWAVVQGQTAGTKLRNLLSHCPFVTAYLGLICDLTGCSQPWIYT
jgi:uncharacterized membrane protein